MPSAGSAGTDLRAAFRNTTYGTATERFRLGEHAGAWPSWAAPGIPWAVLTAWNPAGQPQDAARNQAAQAELWGALPLTALAGINGAGAWQEPSAIVPRVALKLAAELGHRYGQAAVLWAVGRRVALVWLVPRPPEAPVQIARIERWWAQDVPRARD